MKGGRGLMQISTKKYYEIKIWGNGWVYFLQKNKLKAEMFNKLKEKGSPFLEGPKKGATLLDYPQEHLVVIRKEKTSPLVKFEIILHLRCFLLHLLTNNLCRTSSSMINLWIDSRIYQK